MTDTPYIGRFAPSPTGPAHLGTLMAAVGSYLQAKTRDGHWLVRIEDVDTTRTVEGADISILNTLENFGLNWDGEVIYQSEQTRHYQQALQHLLELDMLFPCHCSRRQLAESGSDTYPGNCRERSFPDQEEHAIRVLAEDVDVSFSDTLLGQTRQNMRRDVGDFIVRRRDGLFAYQLAVVVDDAMQGITEIVRGADLLDSTPRQIYLQRLLGYDTPGYCHLPLLVDENGIKISKSQGATAVRSSHREKQLIVLLNLLGQEPPDTLHGSDLDSIWRWAITHWDIRKVATSAIRVSD